MKNSALCASRIQFSYKCVIFVTVITLHTQFRLHSPLIHSMQHGPLKTIILSISLKNIVFSRNSGSNATKPMISFKKNEQQKRIKTRKELIQRILSRIICLKGLLHLKQKNYCFFFLFLLLMKMNEMNHEMVHSQTKEK